MWYPDPSATLECHSSQRALGLKSVLEQHLKTLRCRTSSTELISYFQIHRHKDPGLPQSQAHHRPLFTTASRHQFLTLEYLGLYKLGATKIRRKWYFGFSIQFSQIRSFSPFCSCLSVCLIHWPDQSKFF